MSVAADPIGWLLAATFVLASFAFIVEALLGLLPGSTRTATGSSAHSVAILMPAHDEAAIIARTLDALRTQLPERTRLLVIADNCTDATADLARAAGAEVVERHDPDRRGKGYALDFGRSALAASPPEAVVVLDADCTIGRASIATLGSEAVRSQTAVQARNLLKPDLSAPPMVQISNFAFMVKNFIRQRGAARLGAPAVLTGTGMAIPWALFSELRFSGGSVEDLDLTVELVRRGHPPRFAAEATVLSDPAAMSAARMQRDRWERGFLSTARDSAAPLLARFAGTGKPSLLWLGLHLLTPPLALLVLLTCLSSLLLGLLYAFGGMSIGPLAVQLALLVAIAGLVALAWSIHGRAYVSPATVLKIPLYILWKLPIYARMLSGAERRWNRTDRTGR